MSSSRNKTLYPSSEEALYFVEDVFGRAMVPFVLLGETAKAIIENADRRVESKIEIAVHEKQLTEYGVSTLKMLLPPDAKWTKSKIVFEHHETPVEVKILKRHYRFLMNPDQAFYRLTHFRVPNNFPKYWKARFILQ